MTRRRVLLLGSIAIVTAMAVGTWVLWSGPSAISVENAANIREGMTLADVEAILGGPARNETDLPDNFIYDAFMMVAGPGLRIAVDRRWACRGLIVVVEFDDTGHVVRHWTAAFDVESDHSIVARLRRWLGL